jgi:hypothetical protein
MTSVSVSVANSKPWILSSARSSAWFSMMPLCTTATLSREAIGCALRSLGAPCVAQRVCAMPVMPRQRAVARQRVELLHLALGAHSAGAPVRHERDAGGVVAPVFERLQTCDQGRDDVTPRDRGNDSTHAAIP